MQLFSLLVKFIFLCKYRDRWLSSLHCFTAQMPTTVGCGPDRSRKFELKASPLHQIRNPHTSYHLLLFGTYINQKLKSEMGPESESKLSSEGFWYPKGTINNCQILAPLPISLGKEINIYCDFCNEEYGVNSITNITAKRRYRL